MVAHEGDWLDTDGMPCHSKYKFYEYVQKTLGKGLTFIYKEYSKILNRSLFLFDFEFTSNNYYILVVPATGEEINFEIYGVDHSGALVLLDKREL